MRSSSRFQKIFGYILREYSMVLVVILVGIIFAIINPRFARLFNLLTILQHASMLAIIATGLTFVIILDEFDLSFAFLAGLGACLSVNVVQTDVPGFLAILTALGVGLLVGIVNGLLVTKLRLVSFIATLGTATIIVGLNFFVSGGRTIVVVGGLPEWFNFVGQEELFGISYITFVMIIVVVICVILAKFTQIGRNMYGVGGNVNASLVAGVNVDRTKMIAFMICGLLAGLTGYLMASRLGGAHPKAGDEFLMSGFAAVFIGMTMRGGIPNVIGTVVGAILIKMILNGLTMIGLTYTYQLAINGIIIIVFVSAAYTIRNRLARKSVSAAYSLEKGG